MSVKAIIRAKLTIFFRVCFSPGTVFLLIFVSCSNIAPEFHQLQDNFKIDDVSSLQTRSSSRKS